MDDIEFTIPILDLEGTVTKDPKAVILTLEISANEWEALRKSWVECSKSLQTERKLLMAELANPGWWRRFRMYKRRYERHAKR